MANTAQSWDSFKETLVMVLAEFKPKTVLEWGPGVSTKIMQDFPSVEVIDTVEHDPAWYWKYKKDFGCKVNLLLEKDMEKYPLAQVRQEQYDLAFIDGREREKCLVIAYGKLSLNGLVILHDAERESYQPWIKQYRYIYWQDDGHTCVMTNNLETSQRLEKIFAYSDTPA